MIPTEELNELRDSILRYQDAMGVPTHKETFRELYSNINAGIVLVDKMDGTTTMFYVWRSKSFKYQRWLFSCPQKTHIEVFKMFVDEYERVDAENKSRRGCDVPTI